MRRTPAKGCKAVKTRKAKVDLCPRCKVMPADEPHTCPFAEEINGNTESLCTCCSSCTHDCAMDV